jgi:hypothetical protein
MPISHSENFAAKKCRCLTKVTMMFLPVSPVLLCFSLHCSSCSEVWPGELAPHLILSSGNSSVSYHKDGTYYKFEPVDVNEFQNIQIKCSAYREVIWTIPSIFPASILTSSRIQSRSSVHDLNGQHYSYGRRPSPFCSFDSTILVLAVLLS